MNTKIHSIHFDADKKLIEYIMEKTQKMAQFHENIIDSEVFLKLEKSGPAENKVIEVKLKTPGKTLFAKECGKTFEEAADIVMQALSRQVKKQKEKQKRL